MPTPPAASRAEADRAPWRGTSLALPAILLLAAAVRLYQLDLRSLFGNEAATLFFAQGGIGEIWGSDTHPPLYYLLISLWRLLGESEYLLRLSSVLTSLAAIAVTYRCGEALGGTLTGALAALLLTFQPAELHFAQELRMYPLLELAVACALLGVIRLLRDPGDAATGWRGGWLLYGGGTLVALYTHNMGFLWPAVANLAVLTAWCRRAERRSLLRRWLLINLCVLLLWLPYWPALLAQSGQVLDESFWMGLPPLGQALGELGYLSLGLGPWFDTVELTLAPLFIAIVLFGLTRIPWPLALLLGAVWLLPPLMAWLVSLLTHPVFAIKTLIWSSLGFQLASAVGLAWLLRWAWGRRGSRWLELAVALGLTCAVIGLHAVMTENIRNREYRADWRGLVESIARSAEPDDWLALTPSFERHTYDYYAGRQALAGRTPPRSIALTDADHLRQVVATLPPGGRLWLLRSHWYGEVLPEPAALLASERPCLSHATRLETPGLTALLLVAERDCAATQ